MRRDVGSDRGRAGRAHAEDSAPAAGGRGQQAAVLCGLPAPRGSGPGLTGSLTSGCLQRQKPSGWAGSPGGAAPQTNTQATATPSLPTLLLLALSTLRQQPQCGFSRGLAGTRSVGLRSAPARGAGTSPADLGTKGKGVSAAPGGLQAHAAGGARRSQVGGFGRPSDPPQTHTAPCSVSRSAVAILTFSVHFLNFILFYF